MSTLSLNIDNNTDQSTYRNAIQSGKYSSASVTNIITADDSLIADLAESYLPIELIMAQRTNPWGIRWPTFLYTKLISNLAKRFTRNRINIKKANFSFCTQNADDIKSLTEWPTLQSVELDYYACTQKSISPLKYLNISKEQQAKDNEKFIANLAGFIANHKNLTRIKLNTYSFLTTENKNPADFEKNKLMGLASYYPYYENYAHKTPPAGPVIMSKKATLVLAQALIRNYSLLDVDFGGYNDGPFHDWSENYDYQWLLDKKTYDELVKSLRVFNLVISQIITRQDFFAAITNRNKVAAEMFLTAAQQGDLTKIKILSEKGVSVFVQGIDGNSALHFAARNGHEPMVKYLLKRGADWRLPNREGEIPATLARNNKYFKLAELLQVKPEKPIASYSITPLLPRNLMSDAMLIDLRATKSAKEPKLSPAINKTNTLLPVASVSSFTERLSSYFSAPSFFKQVKNNNSICGRTAQSCTTSQVMMEIVPNQSPRRQKRNDLIKDITQQAIEGAIKGFDAMDSAYFYESFPLLKGISTYAVMIAKDQKNITQLILDVLESSHQPLEDFTDLQIKCLIRALASKLQDNILLEDDSKNLEVNRIIINNDLTKRAMKQVLTSALDMALAEAEYRMSAYNQYRPSAPPLDNSSTLSFDGQLYPQVLPVAHV